MKWKSFSQQPYWHRCGRISKNTRKYITQTLNMDNQKWLKRKYTKSYEIVNTAFSDEYITELKKGCWKVGKLKEPQTIDIGKLEQYPVGTWILFRRSNPVRSYNYPLHYAMTKCLLENFTSSGYHSFGIFEKEFEEIFE